MNDNGGDVLTAVVVDDSKTIRQFLKLALHSVNIQVVGEGESGEDLLPLYERLRPTMVFADIVLPKLDGVDAAAQLLKRYPDALVVICSSLTSRDKAMACQQAGVVRYLLKPCMPEKVAEIGREVAALHRTRVAGAAREQVA